MSVLVGRLTKIRDSVATDESVTVANVGTVTAELSKDSQFVAGSGFPVAAGAQQVVDMALGEQLFARAVGSLATPSGLAATPSGTGGTFAAGPEYYELTAVNAQGETAGSTEVLATVPVMDLAAPTGVTATALTSGGTFASGTYYYKVTALNANGETVGSVEVSVTVTVNGSVTVAWTQESGATGYRIYRATTAGGESTSPALVATVGAVGTYTDTGTATTAGAVPATSTATVSTGSVALTWTADSGATGYRLYRSMTSGGESTSPALVAALGTVTSYTDTGTATTAGSVPASSTAYLATMLDVL